jgi:hypothetical protein
LLNAFSRSTIISESVAMANASSSVENVIAIGVIGNWVVADVNELLDGSMIIVVYF